MGDKRESSLESTQNCKKSKNGDKNLSSLEKLPENVREMIYMNLNVNDLKNMFLVSKKLVKESLSVLNFFHINIFFLESAVS